MDQSFGCHKNFKKSLVSTPFGCKWNQSSETEANGHWRKSVKNWQQALGNALTFGTHKGVPTQPVLLKKLISKDVIHGNSLPVPLLSVKSIPGLVMAPMNIMVQNTINGIRQVIPKDWLTHNQSWQWSSGTSINSRTKKEPPKHAVLVSASTGLSSWQLLQELSTPTSASLQQK